MSFEEVGAFFARNVRPPVDLRPELARCADIAWKQGCRLAKFQPSEHDLLLEAIGELKIAIARPDALQLNDLKDRIVILAGYVHTVASTLDEHMIPVFEANAHAAAQECGNAANWIMRAMNGEFDDRPAERFVPTLEPISNSLE